MILPDEKYGGRHFQVLRQIFSLQQIQRPFNYRRGKFSFNAELTF